MDKIQSIWSTFEWYEKFASVLVVWALVVTATLTCHIKLTGKSRRDAEELERFGDGEVS